MRAFLALLPDRESAYRIDAWREAQWPDIGRPVDVQDLHLTLCFLGEQSPARIDALGRLVDEGGSRAAGGGRRDLLLDLPGWRPDNAVAWLESSAPPGSLAGLAKRMRGLAGRAGIRTDKRPFRPHVTIARGVDLPPPAPLDAPAIELRLGAVTLMESVRGRDGVRYVELASW